VIRDTRTGALGWRPILPGTGRGTSEAGGGAPSVCLAVDGVRDGPVPGNLLPIRSSAASTSCAPPPPFGWSPSPVGGGSLTSAIGRWSPPSGIVKNAFPKLFPHDLRCPMTQPLPPTCFSRTVGTRSHFKATKATVSAATSVSFVALTRRHSGRSLRFASEVAQFSAVLSPTGNRRRIRVCRLPVSPCHSRSIERCPSGGKAQ
jgi:hypothetical protein